MPVSSSLAYQTSIRRKQLTRLVCVCVCVCVCLARSYPRSLATDLKRSGFDAVSMASMHTNDRGLDGIYQTFDSLMAAKIAAAGARRDPEDDDNHWYRLVRAGNWTTAFVACTDDTNMDINQRDIKTQVSTQSSEGPARFSKTCGSRNACASCLLHPKDALLHLAGLRHPWLAPLRPHDG
jgi:hypothetical protein